MDNEKLAAAAKTGDNEALMELWQSVRRVCFRIAGRYGSLPFRAGLDDDDLTQELFLAYYAALMAFDPESGYRFTTFLTYHTQNAIRSVLGIRCKSRKLPPAPLPLDVPLGETEDSDTRGSLVPDPDAEKAFEDAENNVWCKQLHNALEQCLDTLETEQAKVIRGIYYMGLTAAEAGKRVGVNASQATQLKQSGLRKLRQGKNFKRLRGFLQ